MSECEAFLEYLKSERNKSEHTIKSYETSLQQFEEFFGSLDNELTWSTVTGDIVREWIIYLADSQKLSKNSINARLSALKTFYHYLKRIGVETLNPMLRIEGPKKDKILPSFVKEAEMDRLLDSEFPDSFQGILEKTVITLLYLTGMRRSEILSLTDRDIDLNAKQIKVTGKRNKQRLIPFGQELEDCIRTYLKARNSQFEGTGQLLVNAKGKPMTANGLTKIVRDNLSKVTTLKKKSPHVLRHSFATAMLNNRADLVSIQKLLGHADLHTTEVYTHLSFEDLKDVYKQAHPRSNKKVPS